MMWELGDDDVYYYGSCMRIFFSCAKYLTTLHRCRPHGGQLYLPPGSRRA